MRLWTASLTSVSGDCVAIEVEALEIPYPNKFDDERAHNPTPEEEKRNALADNSWQSSHIRNLLHCRQKATYVTTTAATFGESAQMHGKIMLVIWIASSD